MSRREFVALGVAVTNNNQSNTSNTNQTSTTTNSTVANNIVAMAIAIAATQVNPFHDAIDLSSTEGKKIAPKSNPRFT